MEAEPWAQTMTDPCSALVPQGLNTEASLDLQGPLGHLVSQATCGPASAWRISHLTCTVGYWGREEEGRGLQLAGSHRELPHQSPGPLGACTEPGLTHAEGCQALAGKMWRDRTPSRSTGQAWEPICDQGQPRLPAVPIPFRGGSAALYPFQKVLFQQVLL